MLWRVTKGYGVVFPLTDRKTSKPKNYMIICSPIPCICSLYNVEMSIYLSRQLAIQLSIYHSTCHTSCRCSLAFLKITGKARECSGRTLSVSSGTKGYPQGNTNSMYNFGIPARGVWYIPFLRTGIFFRSAQSKQRTSSDTCKRLGYHGMSGQTVDWHDTTPYATEKQSAGQQDNDHNSGNCQ